MMKEPLSSEFLLLGFVPVRLIFSAAVTLANLQKLDKLFLTVQYACSDAKEANASAGTCPKQCDSSDAQTLCRLFLRK